MVNINIFATFEIITKNKQSKYQTFLLSTSIVVLFFWHPLDIITKLLLFFVCIMDTFIFDKIMLVINTKFRGIRRM